ncbi:hypothetical protein BKA83DRAFT_4126958 [Pisolithus microcarpus]|nr:hypothetical protein BKA83DRAFT_4126958 [Pisolithus microcarpus]
MNVSSAPSAARANCGSSDTPDKSASPEGCQKQSIKAYFPREPGIANALPRLTTTWFSGKKEGKKFKEKTPVRQLSKYRRTGNGVFPSDRRMIKLIGFELVNLPISSRMMVDSVSDQENAVDTRPRHDDLCMYLMITLVVTCNRIQLSETELYDASIAAWWMRKSSHPTNAIRSGSALAMLCAYADSFKPHTRASAYSDTTNGSTRQGVTARVSSQKKDRTHPISAPFHLIHYYKLLYLGFLTSLFVGSTESCIRPWA